MNRLLAPTRRGVLTGIGATLVASPNIVRAMTAPVWQNNPFSLGVASGAPATDGFVLWTKLAPEPLASDPRAIGDAPLIPIAYEIASDDSLRHVVRRGTALAERDFGYAVHANVRGLKPGRPYWYRFRSGGEVSAIGRAMTLPPRGTDSLRFAFFSCSHYEYGYFSAYRHAAEENPDFGIFLGDYIYEYADKRRPTVRTHSGGKECETLDEYRARYTQYRLDPDLQALHAAVPALVTWDDHEVQNDYADRFGQDFQDPQAFLMRRAAAYQAFYEFMPVKPVFSKPQGPDMRLYDRYDFGDLMRVDLIDGRQYRSREACYGDPAKKQGDGGGGHQETPAHCPELMDPTRSMIGMTQEAWLFDGLARSKARWNVIANDVLMARLHQKNPAGEDAYWTDGWDGYPPSRTRLMQHIAQSKPSNPVVITGDIHSFWANDLKTDFDDPSAPAIASELVGTSITSYGPPYDQFSKLLPDNPHIKFFDSRKRGYVSVALTRERLKADYQVVSDITDPKATRSTLASFVIEDGKPGPVAA
ncbi:MAG TPA: alkaline phosphatase D family protein [Rhizomicrobium sp.]|jgi:alkaline phosphatase D|nr:alkaline phosphatase D family protein [Rhizomicrobium sp.]